MSRSVVRRIDRSQCYTRRPGVRTVSPTRCVAVDVTVPQDHLQRALAQVGRAVATKTTFPVLSNVLIEASSTGLKLAATNQEIGISTVVPCEVADEGRI